MEKIRKFDLREVADDEQLLQALAGDSLEAFQDLMDRWQERLRRYFWRMTGWEFAADQLFEECMLKLFERRRDWDGSRRFSVQMMVLASRLCRQWLEANALPAPAPEPAGPAGADLESRRRHLQAALAATAPRQREILVLTLLEGMPFGQVSEILETDEETLKIELWQAYARFKRRLGDPFGVRP